MYKRINALLAIIAFLIMFLVVPALTYADQFGIGGALVDGHSEDNGDYGINNEGPQSWGIIGHFDKDMKWKHQISKLNAVGIELSLGLQYLHWTKNDHQKSEVCDGYTCWPKETTRNSSTDTFIMSVGPKIYWEIGKLRTFVSAQPGYARQDGAHDDLAAVFNGGIQYQITRHLGASLSQWETFVSPMGKYDRFDATVLAIELFF